MSLECWQEVINDYEKLLENEKGYDVIIYAGKNENVKEIRAHSLILSTRSQYFCTALSKENEKKDGKIIFRNPDISPQLFKIILRFIYCGRIDLTKLEGPELLKLSMAADKLNINSLIPRIEEYLIKHHSEFLYQNPVGILETVYQHESFTNLWNCCLEKICEEPEMLFNSDKFINLKAPLLELLLRRDDLSLDEIVIWDSLFKWGLAQNPSVSQDFAKWNKEEITIMERTLHRFIPLIRFRQVSPEDFLDRVYPLKELLPKDLVNDLLTLHIAPNRKTNIDIQSPRKSKCVYDSIIIKSKHFDVFSNWIDKKNVYNVMNTPYKFDLLYRASRDGTTVAAFHGKCNNKGATIVVAKITNSEQMVGGYNPFSWESPTCHYNIMTTKDNFIFSFTNRMNFQTAKVSYYNGENGKVYTGRNLPLIGPVFGCGDLYFLEGSCYSFQSLYPKIEGMLTGSFNIEDYEVFQVVKK